MRLLFVADGRSPIALSWISHFVNTGHEVHLISTYPCKPELLLASLTVIPAGTSGILGQAGTVRRFRTRKGAMRVRNMLRHWVDPVTIPLAARRVRAVTDRIRPDLVHAMRVPMEGMLAAAAGPRAPLIVSVWGNDFTLHAPASLWMRHWTQETLQLADGLHVDCRRDLRLAGVWGFSSARPSLVVPTNGGVRKEHFYPASARDEELPPGSVLWQHLQCIPSQAIVGVNPRGFRAYVRNDTFFRALGIARTRRPDLVFVCPAMEGEAEAQRWISQLALGESVVLLPPLSPAEMGSAYRRSLVSVSPSEHDGTPNTLLEAMACGCFPIAGDLESIREWIEPGVNGLLVNPASPEDLARAILTALDNQTLRERAAERNAQLVAERAEYGKVMAEAEAFYRRVIA